MQREKHQLQHEMTVLAQAATVRLYLRHMFCRKEWWDFLPHNLLEMANKDGSDKVNPTENVSNEIQHILNLDLPHIDDANAWKDFFNTQIYSK